MPDPYYTFRALAGLGVFTQWVVMMINGSFVAMILITWEGKFTNGTPVKIARTGIWPLDFSISLLAVFFSALNNLADLPDIGPFLMLLDLIFLLSVFNMMTIIEDRRNRKTGPLR